MYFKGNSFCLRYVGGDHFLKPGTTLDNFLRKIEKAGISNMSFESLEFDYSVAESFRLNFLTSLWSNADRIKLHL